jgi:hypothetical protein
MTSTRPEGLSDQELIERLEVLVKQERVGLVELLAHLAEVDVRKLFLEQACPSMFPYCTERLHFSEAEAYHRIAAARAARRFPVVLEKVRAGELHLSGLTVLAPHLTRENCLGLLEAARHKSKRAIEAQTAELLKEVRKRRFGVVEKPRNPRAKTDCNPSSRSIPTAVRREVFERDGGRCTYVDARGRRCGARELLEFHHVEPWARGPHHDPDRMALLCRAHNQRAAEVEYGRAFMDERRKAGSGADCPRGQFGAGVSSRNKQTARPAGRAEPASQRRRPCPISSGREL